MQRCLRAGWTVPVTSKMIGERQMDESRVTSIFMVCIAEKVGVPGNRHIGRRATIAPEFCLGHTAFKFPEGHSN